MADIRSREDFKGWLEGRPQEVSAVLALRVALRVLPLAEAVLETDGWRGKASPHQAIILPIFRATAAPWFLALAPNHGAAARAAADAAASAGYAVHAAASAVYAARAAASAADIAAYAAYAADAAASAGYAARAAASAADVAADAVYAADATAWAALSADASQIEAGLAPAALARRPLWPEGVPGWATRAWAAMKADLPASAPPWDLWARWYERVRDGAAFPGLEARVQPVLDGFKGTTDADHFALIDALVAAALAGGEAPTAEDIAAIASPVPLLDAEGKLDAAPNAATDRPVVDDDLLALPQRQRAIIATLLAGMPRNAPRSLSSALTGYGDELLVRGVQPILGLLGDLHAIIAADRAASDAHGWLVDGLLTGFERFMANHALLMTHFPLDAKREAVIARITLNMEAVPSRDLTQAMAAFTAHAEAAAQAGVATENFAKVVRAQKENLDIVLSQPPQDPVPEADIRLDPKDRIAPPAEPPGRYAIKRVVAMVAGFMWRLVTLVDGVNGLTKSSIELTTNLTKLVGAAMALWVLIKTLWRG